MKAILSYRSHLQIHELIAIPRFNIFILQLVNKCAQTLFHIHDDCIVLQRRDDSKPISKPTQKHNEYNPRLHWLAFLYPYMQASAWCRRCHSKCATSDTSRLGTVRGRVAWPGMSGSIYTNIALSSVNKNYTRHMPGGAGYECNAVLV